MKNNKTVEGDFVATENTQKQKEVNKAKKSKKPSFFKRVGSKMKDVFSELKKVIWPSFGKVVKQTGVVLVVVILFLVVITAFDYGLLNLLKLISPNM